MTEKERLSVEKKEMRDNSYLEDDEILIAGPDHVWVVRGLLDMARHPWVESLHQICYFYINYQSLDSLDRA